jgi:hypothetical protein
MQALRSLLGRWTLWYITAVGWFAVALGILAFAAPSPEVDSIVYVQVMLADQTGWFLFLIPLAGLIVSTGLSFLKSRDVMRTVWLFVGPVGIAVFFLALLAPTVGKNSRLVHVDRVRAGGQVYNLAYHHDASTALTQPREYVLYKCDQFGVRCEVLVRYTEPATNVSLAVDHGSVVLMANGSVVYPSPLN